MIGPRSMGAGTYASSTSVARHNAGHFQGKGGPQYANETLRTVDAYGGITEPPLTPAQRLIERYERMNTPPLEQSSKNTTIKSTRRQQIMPNSTNDKRQKHVHGHSRHGPAPSASGRITGDGSGANGELRKDRSPIRQSLRNLLSVIKKGAGGISKRRSNDKLSLPAGYDAEHAALQSDDMNLAQVDTNAPEQLRRKMTGQLLYLTREAPVISPDVPGPLMWSTCRVTLEFNKLVVSSFSGDIQLLVHEVSLARCTDIRSVPPSQLSEAEAALLDSMPDGRKMQVFEIVFKGKPKEKFAAKTVRERAGWISAIWDGILPVQEGASARTVSKKAKPQVTEDLIVIAPQVRTPSDIIQIESPRPTPLPQTSPLLNASYSDRSLPPLPPPTPVPDVTPPLVISDKTKNPQNLHLDLSQLQNPISPSIYPPTFATASSAASTPTGSVHATTPDTNPQRLRIETGSLVSPSAYPHSSRPVSVFSASPLPSPKTPGGLGAAKSCPNSPSIKNLGQLSVVRQRLAQIERNHSDLSRQSTIPTSRASTPTKSPMSATSRWSRQEAVFRNSKGRFTESPLPLTPAGSIKDDTGDGSHNNSTSEAKDSGHPEQKLGRERRGTGDKGAPSLAVESKQMQGEISKLSKEISVIKSVIGGESGNPTVHQMVLGIDHRVSAEKKTLHRIQDSLSLLDKRVNDVVIAVSANGPPTSRDRHPTQEDPAQYSENNDIIRALKEVKDQLSTEFPALALKLKEIEGVHARGSRNQENPASTNIQDGKSSSSPHDVQVILDKLDDIKTSFTLHDGKTGESAGTIDSETSKRVENILSLIKEDNGKHAQMAQQQADSVRYLNELNTWLEAFVNNGTSQIQGISMNVDRLCKELGPDDSQLSLVTDIRQLICGMKARDQNFAALQAAVHSLLEVLTASQTQRGADSQTIAGLIDRQRHDQEIMFRAFTAEISGEIKGERLRFVEAMKEATAINVQTHVEHFKQELGREVMTMTEEVGRLHREKQNIENQISDLFSFYSKQKHSEMPLQVVQENVPLSHTRQIYDRGGGARPNIPRSQNRLGSYPR